jgi:hypothetical protein
VLGAASWQWESLAFNCTRHNGSNHATELCGAAGMQRLQPLTRASQMTGVGQERSLTEGR